MIWSAFCVKTGKEYEIRGKLKKIDDKAELWIPRRYYVDIVDRKVVEKSEKVLPGYILVGSENVINPLLLKDFLKYVGPITDVEIALLRAQEGQRKEKLEVGIRILVIEGPFQGCKGLINKHGEGKVSCTVMFQGIEIKADMREDFVSIL